MTNGIDECYINREKKWCIMAFWQKFIRDDINNICVTAGPRSDYMNVKKECLLMEITWFN